MMLNSVILSFYDTILPIESFWLLSAEPLELSDSFAFLTSGIRLMNSNTAKKKTQ